MQRCRCESMPRVSASAGAAIASGGGTPHRCHPATVDPRLALRSCDCGRRDAYAEYYPRSRNSEVIQERLTTTTRACSRETTYVQQDAVRYLAEQKFTETLMQEAELAEYTLEQEEALFQQCMDDIARDMRALMEDERWLFVSEYLSQKAEQRKLSENIRHNDIAGNVFSSSSKMYETYDKSGNYSRAKDSTAHVRFMLDESLNSRDSIGIHTSECLAQSRSNPRPRTNFTYHHVDRHYNHSNTSVSPPTAVSSTHICDRVNGDNLTSQSYGDSAYYESKRCPGDDVDVDLKRCCCEKYDCCICKLSCNRCSPKPDNNNGDCIPGYSYRELHEEDECRPISHRKNDFDHRSHICANHGDYRCPRHGCRTCSPSARPRPRRSRTRCGECHCRRPDPKRTQSEKLPLEDTLRLSRVGDGCQSEAAVSRGNHCRRRSSCRRLHDHDARHRRGHARSLHRCSRRAHPEAVDKATDPADANLKGALASASQKSVRMERHHGSHHLLASQNDDKGSLLSDKVVSNNDGEKIQNNCSRADARRFAPEEERRLLVLIEARDALVQEAVEKGLSDQMVAIDSLNKQIRAFVFSRPGDAATDAPHDKRADVKGAPESGSTSVRDPAHAGNENSESVQ